MPRRSNSKILIGLGAATLLALALSGAPGRADACAPQPHSVVLAAR
jgi:hypothetical protein